MCTIIFETLSKKPNSNEAQNELLELLGFEKIELIEFLFSNSDNVVRAYTLYMNDPTRKKAAPKLSAQTEKQKQADSAKPIVASEILVHTETEKKIKKQIRKEEKRLNKLNLQNLQAEFGETFDPTQLRKLREEQLTEARILQLYNQKKLDSMQKPDAAKTNLYPFVFDSMLKVAQTSAFIAGAKILLPENIKRTDDRIMEEVYIPANDSLSLCDPKHYVGTKEEICFKPLIRIDQLDDIAQIAFSNTKTLNRIQSVVFDSAYNTNQNLLICK